MKIIKNLDALNLRTIYLLIHLDLYYLFYWIYNETFVANRERIIILKKVSDLLKMHYLILIFFTNYN